MAEAVRRHSHSGHGKQKIICAVLTPWIDGQRDLTALTHAPSLVARSFHLAVSCICSLRALNQSTNLSSHFFLPLSPSPVYNVETSCPPTGSFFLCSKGPWRDLFQHCKGERGKRYKSNVNLSLLTGGPISNAVKKHTHGSSIPCPIACRAQPCFEQLNGRGDGIIAGSEIAGAVSKERAPPHQPNPPHMRACADAGVQVKNTCTYTRAYVWTL